MKKSFFVLWLALLCAAAPVSAHDRGHRPRMGVYIGVPFAYPWYGPPSYYYYPPPTVIVRPEPQIYIERGSPEPAPQAQAWWYYCRGSQSYYPYVRECPGGWERVVPTPPPN